MAARNKQIRIEPERVRQILLQWLATRHANVITVKEDTNPKNDSRDDYVVAYEAVFEPHSLDQAYIELWVTTEGYVAIGFERRSRIAERLGVKSGRDLFAAGHEPSCMSESGLLAILDLIGEGQIAIYPTVVPMLGLISTEAVVRYDVLEELASKGYSPINWLKGVSQTEFLEDGHLLHFHRWNQE